MNINRIKTLIQMSGAKYECDLKGDGVLIQNKNTNRLVNIPLDYFFWDDEMCIVRWIKTHLLIDNLIK